MHGKDDGSRRSTAGSDSPGATPASPIDADESTTPSHVRRQGQGARPGTREDELDAFSEDVSLSQSKSRSGHRSRVNDPDIIAIESVSGASGVGEWDGRAGDGRSRPPPLPPSTSRVESAMPPPSVVNDDPQATLPPVSLNDPRIGETLNGRYKLEKLIGKGGMGRVYRAIQSPLNRPVALKILNPEFQKKDPQFVRRFYLEAATAARLTHPNTITVFDYGEAESGELFIVMEYLRGRPLSRVISSEGPFTPERTMHIAIQICRALREAHSKGIIHRDLKPGNILLLEEGDDADFVKVLDFGLVKLFTPPAAEGADKDDEDREPLTPGPQMEGELTRAGMFLGSPKYMSPEQIQGSNLDPRTDIYSLGVLMFQMLAAKPPFNGATSVEVIYKHVNQPVPRVSDVTPGVLIPEELESIIRQCLAKSREDRFPSMADLLVRLKDVKRLVTGVSAASEIGVSLQQLMAQHGTNPPGIASQTNPSIAPMHPSDPGPTRSLRPRAAGEPASRAGAPGGTGSVSISRASISYATTSHASTSQAPGASPVASIPPSPRATPTAADAVAPSATREAAFVEIGDEDTPSALVRNRGSSASRGGGLARVAPIVAGSALVLVLGVAAYVLSSGPSSRVTPPTDPTPAIDPPAHTAEAPQVRVAFGSTPSGAEVFGADGARIGKTPFTKALELPKGGAKKVRFVFKLAGYLDETVDEVIDAEDPEVHALLRVDPAAVLPDAKPDKGKKAPKPGEADYKENPY